MNKISAAFFDFDKTLITVDSAEKGIEFLWKEGIIPLPLMLEILFASILFKKNIISAERMVNLILKVYKGKHRETFIQGVPAFYNEYLKPFLSTNLMQKLDEHKKQGDKIVLLSGSVKYMLNYIAKQLQIETILCTTLEVNNQGLLTGKPEGNVCIGKHKAVAAWQLAQDLSIDLDKSYAYADHISDLPILELVGHPIVVQPDAILKKVAQNRGWKILYHEK